MIMIESYSSIDKLSIGVTEKKATCCIETTNGYKSSFLLVLLPESRREKHQDRKQFQTTYKHKEGTNPLCKVRQLCP